MIEIVDKGGKSAGAASQVNTPATTQTSPARYFTFRRHERAQKNESKSVSYISSSKRCIKPPRRPFRSRFDPKMPPHVQKVLFAGNFLRKSNPPNNTRSHAHPNVTKTFTFTTIHDLTFLLRPPQIFPRPTRTTSHAHHDTQLLCMSSTKKAKRKKRRQIRPREGKKKENRGDKQTQKGGRQDGWKIKGKGRTRDGHSEQQEGSQDWRQRKTEMRQSRTRTNKEGRQEETEGDKTETLTKNKGETSTQTF